MISNPQDWAWIKYIIDFCGGTHLNNIREAERFFILKEEGITKAVHRITGVTTEDAKADEGRVE